MLNYKKITGGRFFCFSPPVMIATFVIEIILLVWVVLRYGLRSTENKIGASLLFFLAVFQLAEYNVCGRFSIDALTWSRIGFVSITMLPPLGIHLTKVITGSKNRAMVGLGYTLAAIFIYIFAFSEWAFNSHVCAGNYAIFQLGGRVGGWYFVYYYVLMAVALWQALVFLKSSKRKKYTKKQLATRKALAYLISGYGFFIIPTTIINMLKPETIDGIPSIMCGFAVIFAIVLTFGILPELQRAKTKKT